MVGYNLITTDGWVLSIITTVFFLLFKIGYGFFSLLYFFQIVLCSSSHLKNLICAFVFPFCVEVGVGNPCCDKSRVASKYSLLACPPDSLMYLSETLFFLHSILSNIQNISPSFRRLIAALWPLLA